jgi:hypothetical protein
MSFLIAVKDDTGWSTSQHNLMQLVRDLIEANIKDKG